MMESNFEFCKLTGPDIRMYKKVSLASARCEDKPVTR